MLCVYVCVCMRVYLCVFMGMLSCVCLFVGVEMKGDIFIYINIDCFVSRKRINNVMFIRKDKK